MRFRLTALGVLLLFSMAGCESSNSLDGVSLNEPFPKMALMTLEGEPFQVTGLQDKVVVLKLWATWCSICIESEPAFKAFIKKLNRDKVEVVSLSVDGDVNLVREYLLDHVTDHLQLLDVGMKQTIKVLGVDRIPLVFIIDHQGILRHYVLGRSPWGDDMQKIVQNLTSLAP